MTNVKNLADDARWSFVNRQMQDLQEHHGTSHSGGDGGGGDMLEMRVKHLEDDMKDVKADLKAMRSDIAEIKGHLKSMPTTIQLLGFVIAIFVAAGVMKLFG